MIEVEKEERQTHVVKLNILEILKMSKLKRILWIT